MNVRILFDVEVEIKNTNKNGVHKCALLLSIGQILSYILFVLNYIYICTDYVIILYMKSNACIFCVSVSKLQQRDETNSFGQK
jgi:hypothetical protein